jgi:hypothetical protein
LEVVVSCTHKQNRFQLVMYVHVLVDLMTRDRSGVSNSKLPLAFHSTFRHLHSHRICLNQYLSLHVRDSPSRLSHPPCILKLQPYNVMSKPTLNKRRPSFPSSAPENVLRNIDTPTTLKPPMALIKHGKYVLAGVGGMWYTGFVDAVGSVLDIDRLWIRLVGI